MDDCELIDGRFTKARIEGLDGKKIYRIIYAKTLTQISSMNIQSNI